MAGTKVFCFYENSRPPLGPNHPPVQWVLQARLPRDKEGEGMKLNTHLHIVPRLRSGVTTPHPRTLLWYVQKRHLYLFFSWLEIPSGPWPHAWGSSVTLRHTTLSKTFPDEWPARRRDLYLTAHNTHKRQAFMTAAEFEPPIPVSNRPYTHDLDRAATEISIIIFTRNISKILDNKF
jgi:hypothetical protein